MSDRNVFSNRRGVWTPSNPRSRLPPVEKEIPKGPTLNLTSTNDFPSLGPPRVSVSAQGFRPIPDFKAAAAKGVITEKIYQTQAYNKNVSEIPIIPIIRRYKPSVKQIDMSIYDEPIEDGFSDNDEEIVKIKRRSHNTDSTKFVSTVRLRIQQAQNFDGKPLDQEDLEKSNTPPYGPGPDDDF
jgi:hypothetical protein